MIRSLLLQNWDITRWIRLGLAVMFLVAGILKADTLAYFAAGFFGLQAVFNVGCCGMSCAPSRTDRTNSAETAITDVQFEEIHAK